MAYFGTKFDSQATQSLYAQTADDELGQSYDGHSWYGLYRGSVGGSIVIEDTYGFVGRVDFDTTQELMAAWETLATDDDLCHGDAYRDDDEPIHSLVVGL